MLLSYVPVRASHFFFLNPSPLEETRLLSSLENSGKCSNLGTSWSGDTLNQLAEPSDCAQKKWSLAGEPPGLVGGGAVDRGKRKRRIWQIMQRYPLIGNAIILIAWHLNCISLNLDRRQSPHSLKQLNYMSLAVADAVVCTHKHSEVTAPVLANVKHT